MKVISTISDELLQANNVLLEMTIQEYLDIGLRILSNNQYQRKRVSRSSTIYSLLNQDIKKQCSIPTIVLAFINENNKVILHDGMEDQDIKHVLNSRNLIILDGLQRTYTMRDVDTDSSFSGEDKKRFKNHKIRVEVYCGLTNTGILYRMLTLNTGQTPMSKRHEIEILYSSYQEREIEGITFIKQVDNVTHRGIDVYNFDDAVEGFNSFLDADEAPMDRLDLLDVVQRLEKVANNEYHKDLFLQYIKLYNRLVHRLDDESSHWTLKDEQQSKLKSVYGKDIPGIFNKAQTMSAFGAALGKLLEKSNERGFSNFENRISEMALSAEPNAVFFELLNTLQDVRKLAKKIGVAQRLYLKLLFINLLDEKSETYGNLNKTIKSAKKQYDGTIIQPR